MTFIVTVTGSEGGETIGVIERVRTREKRPFRGVDNIGPVIARMVATQDGSACDSPNAEAPGDDS